MNDDVAVSRWCYTRKPGETTQQFDARIERECQELVDIISNSARSEVERATAEVTLRSRSLAAMENLARGLRAEPDIEQGGIDVTDWEENFLPFERERLAQAERLLAEAKRRT
jgi:hypothetical protein